METNTGDDVKNLWKNQQVEPAHISLDELQKKAKKLEKRVLWRNLREYAASVIVMVCFGYYLWQFPSTMVRVGCVLVISGALLMVCMLHKKGASRTVPAEMAFRSCLDFHRTELERQRDLLRGVWTWYLLPFVPGMAVFLLGLFRWTMKLPHAPAHARVIIITFCLMAAVCAIVFFAIGKLNQWAACKLQREIDALNGLEKEL
jgi:hypothetical protein